MHKEKPKNIPDEKRVESRSTDLEHYRIEIKFTGEPIYQCFTIWVPPVLGIGLS
jgi:hypothetical protein